MSTGEGKNYKIEHTFAVKEQVDAIASLAAELGKKPEFIAILNRAVHRLQTDPHGFGDPEYHLKLGNGVVCHALIRPVFFRYVVYEEVRGIVFLRIRLYANFD